MYIHTRAFTPPAAWSCAPSLAESTSSSASNCLGAWYAAAEASMENIFGSPPGVDTPVTSPATLWTETVVWMIYLYLYLYLYVVLRQKKIFGSPPGDHTPVTSPATLWMDKAVWMIYLYLLYLHICIDINIWRCIWSVDGKHLRFAARRPHAGNKPGDPVNGQGGVNDVLTYNLPIHLYRYLHMALQ